MTDNDNLKFKGDKKTFQALYKKALGYRVNEKVEEFVFDEKSNKMVLNKKKVNQKYIPPDTVALKTLLDMCDIPNERLDKLSDDELKKEKRRLLKLLKNLKGEENEEPQ